MSKRPSTRSKNKRQRPDDNADAMAEIYRKIHLTGKVSEDDLTQLYVIWKPVCQGCRSNTKENPNCFCALIPPPNGSRKSGLWQKTSDIILLLGPDPSKDSRDSLDSPAGLTNLGATCYANSILQFLYMNKSFRQGVLSVEPEVLKEQPVLNQLARLFAQLLGSRRAFIDSAPFIETLALDNGIQQDSHEFLTLLFSLLEQFLSHSKVSKARTTVQDLFRGGMSHVTKCSACGNESEASSNIQDFYGLELNVKGFKSLDESLDDYFSVEELQGDNQYFCESCAGRVNATRSIKLRSLPPALNFQLKRCVFLPNATMKKKITSAFYFPEKLDMAGRLSECPQSELIYELSTVLIHKGSAVNSGHYVAHIKDEDTEQWWEFDDEVVTNLGQHPFGGDSSKPSESKGVQNGNRGDVGVSKSSPSEDVGDLKNFSSTDAYMLMYSRRDPTNEDKKSETDSIRKKTKANQKESSSQKKIDDILPSHLLEEVNQLNSSYLHSCEQYKLKKESELELINERRTEVRSVISEAPLQSLEEPFFWISSDWLRQWSDNVTSVKIDNAPLQCFHGKVPVSKTGFMKRLSPKAWTKLFSKYDGGPELSKKDCCVDCILEMARTMVSADTYRDGRISMKSVAEAALNGKCPDETLYYVSKSWLQQWARRKIVDSPCEADTEPTASIRCPHGALMPEQAPGAKRVLVPERLWLFIYAASNAVKPDDVLGCSAFPSDSEPCGHCGIELLETTSQGDILRDFKLKQRQSHDKLAMGKNLALHPRSKYYLLPSSWLSKWRNYITASGKNAGSVDPPETLRDVVPLLKCEQHSRLIERPPDLLWKRGVILQKTPTAGGLTIIGEDDWKLFCEDWNGIVEDGISAEIDVSSSVDYGQIGASGEMPMSEENMSSLDEGNNGVESQSPVIKTSPEVCEDCIGERESCELMKKLDYCDEDISVCFVRGKEPPKYILEASANISESNRRTSKRSRKTSFGNSVNLKVSGSTSIYQLKMMIWQSFGIVKENQIIHKGLKVIDDESASLADVNVFPGDILWVRDSEVHEDRDIADELSDDKMDLQKTEEGFRGTLLTSNLSSHVFSEACYN